MDFGESFGVFHWLGDGAETEKLKTWGTAILEDSRKVAPGWFLGSLRPVWSLLTSVYPACR